MNGSKGRQLSLSTFVGPSLFYTELFYVYFSTYPFSFRISPPFSFRISFDQFFLCLRVSVLFNHLYFLSSFTSYYYYYYYYYYCRCCCFIPLSIFLTNISWWFSTGVWVTAILLKSPGLFAVLWPISIMLLSKWSPHIVLYPSHPVPYRYVGDCSQCSTNYWYIRHLHVPCFLVLKQALGTYLSFRFLKMLLCDLARR